MRQVLGCIVAFTLVLTFGAGKAPAQYRGHPNSALIQQRAYYVQQLLLRQQLAQYQAAAFQGARRAPQRPTVSFRQQQLHLEQRLAASMYQQHPLANPYGQQAANPYGRLGPAQPKAATAQQQAVRAQQAPRPQQVAARPGIGGRPAGGGSATVGLLRAVGDLIQAGPVGALFGSLLFGMLAPMTALTDILGLFFG